MIALTLAIATRQTAEEWLARAERAAREAQTMQVEMSFDLPTEEPAAVEGDNRIAVSISIKRPDRFQMDMRGRMGGEEAHYDIRGDGDHVGSRTQEPGEQPQTRRHNQPANIVPLLAMSLARGASGFGILFRLFEDSDQPPELPERLDGLARVRDLTLDGEEEIDGRRTIRLKFTTREQVYEGVNDRERDFPQTLWLDAETARPVRCQIIEGEERPPITIRFTRFEYDGVTADADFAIPSDWGSTDAPPDK